MILDGLIMLVTQKHSVLGPDRTPPGVQVALLAAPSLPPPPKTIILLSHAGNQNKSYLQ